MDEKTRALLTDKADAESLTKLEALGNAKLDRFVADAVELCQPDAVKVFSDAPEDVAAIRQWAIDNNEETPLSIDGHTIHFDGYNDQARDKDATKYLVPKGMDFDRSLNYTDREEGLEEIMGFFEGSMKGKTMLVLFLCLGPVDSPFSIPCVQITDSAYVAHSETILYRMGYEQFKKLNGGEEFFRFLHSAGRLGGENNTALDVDKRRVYIDIEEDRVLSVNTQYAGNTVGLKKLALRLAIRKADREGWLAEHMFVMGAHGPGGRVTYFTGAFPSACGKTSTAMLPGETIVGDDLAYFRKLNGEVRTVNVEAGIFGIIRDVNPDDDPVIYQVLTNPGEVIFSNVLVKEGRPYWLGMGSDIPSDGWNYVGKNWTSEAKGPDGKETTPSHKNARYTVRISALSNRDERADDPDGVPVGGVIYGGRDSDTSVPVQEAMDWTHGIITMGASLESETTAATLGAEGVRKFNIMSNLDFLSMPLGKYILNNLNFVEGASSVPKVFGVNYFLKKDGKYLNGMLDKGVWMKWMELRVHGDVDAIESPTGLMPKYEDLQALFQQVLGKDYTRDDYVEQFTVRIPENLDKILRIEQIYQNVQDTPKVVFETLAAQRERLKALQGAKGDYVSPEAIY
jgi:phosphoenolpyruvate carboxykinase (GTP)